MNDLRLSIEGMHCGACVRRVTNALTGVEGVRVDSVEVGSARIGFAPETTTVEQVTAALERIGFHAHQVER